MDGRGRRNREHEKGKYDCEHELSLQTMWAILPLAPAQPQSLLLSRPTVALTTTVTVVQIRVLGGLLPVPHWLGP